METIYNFCDNCIDNTMYVYLDKDTENTTIISLL